MKDDRRVYLPNDIIHNESVIILPFRWFGLSAKKPSVFGRPDRILHFCFFLNRCLSGCLPLREKQAIKIAFWMTLERELFRRRGKPFGSEKE